MKNIISNTKVINCKRQLPNLKRFLVQSELKEQHHQPKVSKCNDIRCGLCCYLIEGASVTTKSNMTCLVKQNMNCSVENNLYALRCNGCDEIYICNQYTVQINNNYESYNKHISYVTDFGSYM